MALTPPAVLKIASAYTRIFYADTWILIEGKRCSPILELSMGVKKEQATDIGDQYNRYELLH